MGELCRITRHLGSGIRLGGITDPASVPGVHSSAIYTGVIAAIACSSGEVQLALGFAVIRQGIRGSARHLCRFYRLCRRHSLGHAKEIARPR